MNPSLIKGYLAVKSLTITVFVCILSLGSISLSHADQDRTMHPITLRQIVLTAPGSGRVPTHVCTEGTAEYIRRQGDGDLHIRVCDQGLCIVGECVPYLPCGGTSTELDRQRPRPKKGDRVKVCGITRYDGPHGWWEIHPIERIEVLSK